jgi:hypothetical protein
MLMVVARFGPMARSLILPMIGRNSVKGRVLRVGADHLSSRLVLDR